MLTITPLKTFKDTDLPDVDMELTAIFFAHQGDIVAQDSGPHHWLYCSPRYILPRNPGSIPCVLLNQ